MNKPIKGYLRTGIRPASPKGMTVNLQLEDSWIQRFTGLDAPLAKPGELEQWIVYQDDHILALNKPGWLVCHPSKNGPMSSLVGVAKEHLQLDKSYLVSRLDRETSGIVLIAKTKKGASCYQRAIEQRRVHKTYWVWLQGKLDGKTEVNKPLARDMESPVYVKQTVRKSNSSQSAVTIFEPRFYSTEFDMTVAEVIPVTGRKHQIRAHAQWLGTPVYGDKIYGPDANCYLEFIEKGWTVQLQQTLGFPRQALHASRLVFDGIELQTDFHAPLTPDLLQLSHYIGWDNATAEN